MKLKFIGLKARSPLEIVNSLFEFTYKNYDLRNVSVFKRKRNLAVHYGSGSLSSLAQKICELALDSVRDEKLSNFKNKIRI